MSAFIHIVADYGPGDLAFSEIISALACQLPADARWHITPVDSFNTISTGFIVAQLALQKPDLRPHPLFVYANCAPRQDRSEARPDNAGEGLVYAKLNNGVELIVVNSGFSLSFVRDQIEELWALNVGDAGSQFRSRDIFPKVVAELAHGRRQHLEQQLSPAGIPTPPANVIAYIDSFENLKTTVRGPQADWKPGQKVEISLNGVTKVAHVAGGSFEVADGTIALAPGSSGHQSPYWEIFRRGGSALAEFGNPKVGAEFKLRVLAQK